MARGKQDFSTTHSPSSLIVERPVLPVQTSRESHFKRCYESLESKKSKSTDHTENQHLFEDDEAMDFGTSTDSGSFGSAGLSFTAVNDQGVHSAASTHTVSPQELFMDHSAPNSNTFTNLTTPSMYDGSPDDFSSYEASPLFSTNEIGDGQPWPSLFADDEPMYAPAQQMASTGSHNDNRPTSAVSASMTRTASASSAADASKHRMSISAGVHKNKRTGRLLGPIEVDTEDTAAMKRAKNTMAARKSRQKKRDVEDSLRDELAEMTAQRDRWMHIAIQHGAPLPDVRDPKSP